MTDFQTSEEIREFLLNTPHEFEEDLRGVSGNCYSLSWKKDHWIIRVNNKKVGTITTSDVPNKYNLSDSNLVFVMLAALRRGGQDELKTYLKGLCDETH